MKTFTKITSDIQTVGSRFKRQVVVKKFQTEDGLEHEFTTWTEVGGRSGGVIAITPDKKVITTYQFRGGPEQWMHEIPGGGLNPGEDPRVGALRELKEETGYVSDHVEFLGAAYGDAYTNALSHYYLATNCVLAADGSQLDDEEDEQGVEVRLITIDEFIENAKHGRMTDPRCVLMAYEKLKELNND